MRKSFLFIDYPDYPDIAPRHLTFELDYETVEAAYMRMFMNIPRIDPGSTTEIVIEPLGAPSIDLNS